MVTSVCHFVHAQSTASDNTVPIQVPPPMDTIPQQDKNCKPAKKLIYFSLPCCVDKATPVASIATLRFSDSKCDAPAVKFEPEILTPPKTTGPLEQKYYSTQTVKAISEDVVLTASIDLVNPDLSRGFTPVQFPFKSLQECFDKGAKAIANGGVSPCKPSGSFIPSSSLGFDLSTICCPQPDCVKQARKYSGSAKWSYGLTCHFPVAGIPFIATLDVVVSASASATVKMSYKTGCNAGKACADLQGEVAVGGGGGGTFLSGAVLMEAQVIGSGGITGTWCFYPDVEKPAVKFYIAPVKLVYSASALWGWTQDSGSFQIFSGWSI